MDGPDIQPASKKGGTLYETGAADARRRRGSQGPHVVRQFADQTHRSGMAPFVVIVRMRTLGEADDDERKGDQDSGRQAHASPGSSGIDLVCHGSPSVLRIVAPARPIAAVSAAAP